MEKINYIAPAMISNKKIYRNDPPRYVTFSEETIKKCVDKFHRQKREGYIDINHDGKVVDGIKMIGDHILSDSNRDEIMAKFENKNEYLNLPNGSWIIEYEIINQDIINKIKNEELNGLSIEGIFYEKKVK